MARITSDKGLEAGTRVRVADKCQNTGRCGSVVGSEVFIGQWWCPVLWDDSEDPDFCKSGCLEPLGRLAPEDWREILHLLTAKAKDLDAASRRTDPPGRRAGATGELQDHLTTIVGKVCLLLAAAQSGKIAGPGGADGLVPEDWKEICDTLETAAGGEGDKPRLRMILGKIGHPDWILGKIGHIDLPAVSGTNSDPR